MRGEFIGVWSETWREIWLPLIDKPLVENGEGVPEDIFSELYRVLAGDPKQPGALKKTPSVQDLADIVDSPLQSREAFERTRAEDLAGERALVAFLESAYDALEEVGGDELTNHYFNLLATFIEKFSLRYDLRRPCVLCPTLPGLFASLVRNLRVLTAQDAHLDKLMKEYEESVRDLRLGCSDGRIRTCIGKQFMLLEALGALAPGVTKGSLGDMCDELSSWPHSAVRESLKKLYGFASDYPGIRHGSNRKGAMRDIDMRDMVAMSVLLTGYTPYVEERLRADEIYGGGKAANAVAATQPPLTASSSVSGSLGPTTRGFLNRLRERLWGARA
jgi:hypothetical protein